MRRHRRRASLSDLERKDFVDAAVAMHKALTPFSIALKPTSHDGQAIKALHHTLVITFEKITGERPPWTNSPGPANLPSGRDDR